MDTSFNAGHIDVRQTLGLTTLQASLPDINSAEAAPVSGVNQWTAPIAPGRIIVKFKDTLSQSAISGMLATLLDMAAAKAIPAIDVLVLRVPEGTEWKTMINCGLDGSGICRTGLSAKPDPLSALAKDARNQDKNRPEFG